MDNVYSIILAGGFGRRLYPLSTEQKPKQFHDFTGCGKTLVQLALVKSLDISHAENIYTIGSKTHAELLKAQLTEINSYLVKNIILEDVPKNTAYSVWLALQKIEDGILVIQPSDHYIAGHFDLSIEKAIKLAKIGKIVTFGIKPTEPNTNYGYILQNRFIEKPTLEKAEELIKQGAFWNSGIFVASTKALREEFAKYYNGEEISIDKAIMEKTDKIFAIEALFDWADLGSFEAIEKLKNKMEIA